MIESKIANGICYVIGKPMLINISAHLSEENGCVVVFVQRRIHVHKGVNSCQDKVEGTDADNAVQHRSEARLDDAKAK